jgi:hypothetical protein
VTRGLPHVWGATPAEVEREYPADHVFPHPTTPLTRAVSVAAPAERTYRWLCQIAVAPYSYDLLDNLGRKSPRTLTPGADELHVGQRVQIFELTEVAPGHHWTGRTTARARRVFGDLAITYAAEPDGPDRSRLVCRIVARAGWLPSRARFLLLAWGDLVMMRRQLLNLKALAGRDAADGVL